MESDKVWSGILSFLLFISLRVAKDQYKRHNS